MASEENRFTFGDVVRRLLPNVARHPHVFLPVTCLRRTIYLPRVRSTSLRIPPTAPGRGRWEERKEERARKKGDSSALADIPTALPGLSRLQKLRNVPAAQAFFPRRRGCSAQHRLTAEQLSQTLCRRHGRRRADR